MGKGRAEWKLQCVLTVKRHPVDEIKRRYHDADAHADEGPLADAELGRREHMSTVAPRLVRFAAVRKHRAHGREHLQEHRVESGTPTSTATVRTSLATPPALAYASLVCFPVRRLVMMRVVSAAAKIGARAEMTRVSFQEVVNPRMRPVRSCVV